MSLLTNLVFYYKFLNLTDDATGNNPFTSSSGTLVLVGSGPVAGEGSFYMSSISGSLFTDANSDLADWPGDYTTMQWGLVADETIPRGGLECGENNTSGWDSGIINSGVSGFWIGFAELPGSDNSYPQVLGGNIAVGATWHQLFYEFVSSTTTQNLYVDTVLSGSAVAGVGQGPADPTNIFRIIIPRNPNRIGPSCAWKRLLTGAEKTQTFSGGPGGTPLPYDSWAGPPATPHGIIMIGH